MSDALSTELLNRLGIAADQSGVYCGGWQAAHGPPLVSTNPATGQPLGRVLTASREDYDRVAEQSGRAFVRWREMPPPARGEVVRRLGEALRRHKQDLGLLVTLEVGKIRSEGLGEVQEMIDMCDFATGLSRQLHGLTIASERPRHRMFEQWHPLGPVGVITAFNFPVAVWAWNAALAAVCGDPVVWKPSPLAPLCAVAVQRIIDRELAEDALQGVFNLCLSHDAELGRWMAADRRLPLISATGSCAMGRSVAATVAARLGRVLLELGGNNAVVVTQSADLDLALRAVLFAAVGTAGQRCTTLRRLLLHESVAETMIERLVAAYGSIPSGEPWRDDVLLGPLISQQAVERMLAAVDAIRVQGGQILAGGQRLERPGYFVQPTLARVRPDLPIVAEETFAPILYVMTYRDLDEAIAIQNGVDQGLSSAIFTDRVREAEQFLSPAGSDCGIANVNIGTSGAEIGGAFGGEKDTGGGREAGSDAWKAYMRRQTCTVNYGHSLPLAQGVRFEIP
ncbi:MAG: aldehyde dehydrogenase family protein [Pirellulaceae bacterium]|nr:aldehyde dehydrogenase family protein [Pirellulaceae bacterium]